MLRTATTGGLILSIIGFAVSPFADMWSFTLIMLGLAIISASMLVSISQKVKKNKVAGWACIILGLAGLVVVLVVTRQPLTQSRAMLVIVSVICMGLGVFVGPHLLMLAKIENNKGSRL